MGASCNEAGSLFPGYTWFFLAMAHQRLGHAEEARRWLDKGIKWMAQETQNNNAWNRRVTLQPEFLLHFGKVGMRSGGWIGQPF